jgi:acid phosphatase (class A)
MGGGWLGGGWQGGGWQGGGWQGGGWQGGGWMSGGGGEGLYAMRADQPLVSKDADATFKATAFPKHYWDSDLYALTILPDFFTATVGGQSWHQYITVDPPPVVREQGYVPTVPPHEDSIDDLRILAVTERPEAMGEILNQANNQQLCFMQLLMMTQNSHPKTFFAMKLAARVGEVVMMRLKRQWNRPRPTQYCPTLYPPIPVPGHASYPAGHALIAHLTAEVLKEITERDPGYGNPPVSPYKKSLEALADQIGLNRVIAGLHFRSDIRAGAAAGRKTHEFLKGITGNVPATPPPPPPLPALAEFTYDSVISAAKMEWA